MNGYEQALQVVIMEFLSVFGALACLLNLKEKTAMRVSNIFTRCFVAAFSGALVFFVSQHFAFSTNLACVIAGICGWGGPRILDASAAMIMNKAGIELEKQSK